MAPEILAEKVVQTPEDTSVVSGFLEKLSQAVSAGQDAYEYVRTEAVSLTQNQLKQLDARFREGIDLPDSLKFLANRDQILEFTSGQLQSLRGQVNAFIESVTPNMSPETRSNVKAAAVGVGVAGGVVGLYLLGKYLFGKAKAAVETTAERASTAWTWFKYAAGFALAATAGYLGFKAVEKYLTVGGKIRSLEQKIREAEAVIAKAGELPEEVVRQAEQAKEELKKALEQVRTPTPKTEAAPEATPATRSVIPAKTPEAPREPSVPERATEILRAGSPVLIARGLVLLEDLPGWSPSNRTKEVQIIDVLQSNKDSTVTAFLSADKQNESVRGGNDDPASRSSAVEFLQGFIRKELSRLEAEGENTADLRNGTLSVFFENAASSHAVVGSLVDVLKEHKGDLIEAMNSLSKNPAFAGGEAVRGRINEYVQEYKEEHPEMQNITAVDVLELLLDQGTGTMEAYLASNADENNGADIIVRDIADEMREMETEKYMLPFFHKVFPEHDWSENNEENIAVVHDILWARMPVSQAVRMHMYARWMSEGNPTGVILMQAEIVKYVADHDNVEWMGYKPGYKKYQVMNRVVDAAAGNGLEELANMDTLLDPELVQKALSRLGVVGKDAAWFALQKLASGITETGTAIAVTASERPLTTAAVATATVVPATVLINRRIALMTQPHRVLERLRTLETLRSADTTLPRRAIALLEISKTDASEAASKFALILQKIDELKADGANSALGQLLDDEMRTLTGKLFTSTESAWDDFAKALGKHATIPEVGKIIGYVSDIRASKGLQYAISVGCRPWLSRLGAAGRTAYRAVRASIRTGVAVTGELTNLTVQGARAAAPLLSDGVEVAKDLTANAASKVHEALSVKPVTQPELAALIAKHKGLKPAQVDVFLEAAKKAGIIDLDQPTLALIKESPGAQKIIAGATNSGSASEMTRALNAAKGAAKMRAAVNALGVAGDVFGIYMAYADWEANGKRIEETENPALKELYSQANTVYAVEGGTSAAGLVVGGYAIVTAYTSGQGLLAAAGASGGLIMLPVAVAVVAGGLYYRELEYVTAEWLKNEDDWAKMSSGELIKQLRDRAPGTQGYFQGAARETNAEMLWNWATQSSEDRAKQLEEQYELVEDANAGMRFKVTRALLRKNTMLNQEDGEADDAFQERHRGFVADQARYLANLSGGAFAEEFPSQYAHAHLHAELLALSDKLNAGNQSLVIPLTVEDESGTEVLFTKETFDLRTYRDFLSTRKNAFDVGENGLSPERIILAYKYHQNAQLLQQATVHKHLRDEEGKVLDGTPVQNALCQKLLMDLRYELARCQAKVHETNFPGVAFGWEEQAESQVCSATALEVTQIIKDGAKDIVESAKDPTLGSYKKIIDRARSVLSRDPLKTYEQLNAKTLRIGAETDTIAVLELSEMWKRLSGA